MCGRRWYTSNLLGRVRQQGTTGRARRGGTITVYSDRLHLTPTHDSKSCPRGKRKVKTQNSYALCVSVPQRSPVPLGFDILILTVLLALVLVVPSIGMQSAAAQVTTEGVEPLPPGARVETVLEGMRNPVAMAFDPQGRLFY